MQELTIKKFPDPVLRKKASKVSKVTAREKEALAEMAKVMYISEGVGLAAVQVGLDKQLAVIDVGSGLIKLVNPVITKSEGTSALDEGCLSVPGVSVKVGRAASVTVSFLDEEGCARQLRAEGLLARAMQHELDHLSGKLIIDYLNPVKKILIKRKIGRNIKKR
ncbi:MAG: peptide deformylase [Candidatus Omnitrophota bacterium]|nr:peptide deformylase [Candidatus Omnitrophota bacterium]